MNSNKLDFELTKYALEVETGLNEEGFEWIGKFPKNRVEDMKKIVRVNSEGIEKTKVTPSNVIPAIPTLYNIDWTIDYGELERMLKVQKEAWIEWVLIAWTTWESSMLGEEEQIKYVQKAVEIASKLWLKVLAWSWSNSTKEQRVLTKWVFEAWADASLLLPPYYIKASDTDIIKHLVEWLNYWPAIIYSIFWRTGLKISSEVLEILSAHPNFLWVKECDWSQKISDLVNRWIRVWTWNDDKSISNIYLDWACGSISVVCNIDPELILKIKEWINLTKLEVKKLLELSSLVFPEWQPNPKSIHNIMEMIRRWIDEGLNNIPATFRLPCWPFDEIQQEYVSRALSALWIKAKPFGNNYNLIS